MWPMRANPWSWFPTFGENPETRSGLIAAVHVSTYFWHVVPKHNIVLHTHTHSYTAMICVTALCCKLDWDLTAAYAKSLAGSTQAQTLTRHAGSGKAWFWAGVCVLALVRSSLCSSAQWLKVHPSLSAFHCFYFALLSCYNERFDSSPPIDSGLDLEICTLLKSSQLRLTPSQLIFKKDIWVNLRKSAAQKSLHLLLLELQRTPVQNWNINRLIQEAHLIQRAQVCSSTRPTSIGRVRTDELRACCCYQPNQMEQKHTRAHTNACMQTGEQCLSLTLRRSQSCGCGNVAGICVSVTAITGIKMGTCG